MLDFENEFYWTFSFSYCMSFSKLLLYFAARDASVVYYVIVWLNLDLMHSIWNLEHSLAQQFAGLTYYYLKRWVHAYIYIYLALKVYLTSTYEYLIIQESVCVMLIHNDFLTFSLFLCVKILLCNRAKKVLRLAS